jgi:hypothetical protein
MTDVPLGASVGLRDVTAEAGEKLSEPLYDRPLGTMSVAGQTGARPKEPK